MMAVHLYGIGLCCSCFFLDLLKALNTNSYITETICSKNINNIFNIKLYKPFQLFTCFFFCYNVTCFIVHLQSVFFDGLRSTDCNKLWNSAGFICRLLFFICNTYIRFLSPDIKTEFTRINLSSRSASLISCLVPEWESNPSLFVRCTR